MVWFGSLPLRLLHSHRRRRGSIPRCRRFCLGVLGLRVGSESTFGNGVVFLTTEGESVAVEAGVNCRSGDLHCAVFGKLPRFEKGKTHGTSFAEGGKRSA